MKTIVGNWKMNGDAGLARALAEDIAAFAASSECTVVLCPPATLLSQVATHIIGSRLHLGGQDCHWEPQGAYTGDISAAMLMEAGCRYVIIGHSERRQHHGETDDIVRRKASAAIAAGLKAIICIGETQAERDAGKAEEVVAGQVAQCIPPNAGEGHFLLAYEPVWAIGSGKTPTAIDIGAMHSHISAVAATQTGLAQSQISVLYGGSVKAGNAQEILALPGVSGALVGGASLNAEEFCKIIAAGR